MTDFLLELRCEEIPARMQAGARKDLGKLFGKEMQAAGVPVGAVMVWSTPRRLALIARDLPESTESVREETKGPRTSAPPQALEGFLRKTGLTQDQLEDRDGVYFAVVEKPGRPVRDVLAEAIPAIVRAFPWPKSMRWGDASLSTESLRWVRPLSGIVAIFGEDLVECTVGEIESGYATLGHRFHHEGPITIGGADDYQGKLRACHVIVDHAEREAMIREGATRAAAEVGLELVPDEGLVIENAGLTEWPVPLLGRFDVEFLEVPPEVIQLTARTNQKYFVCEKDGKLANAFVCTANIGAPDGGEAIVAGNRKVLAARLSDARFFWEQDRKKALDQHAEGLKRITFHEKLGTVADKVERVAKLARWLAEEGIVQGANPGLAEQAARLAKADLVTEMVGEFPELQGLMGGYYARAEGLPDEVAGAIRDHYKPVGQGDDVPTAPVTVAVSLADKLDTLVSFFVIKERPTGSRDPFALRRAALGIIEIILRSGLRLELDYATYRAGQMLKQQMEGVLPAEQHYDWIRENLPAELFLAVPEFFVDRLKVQQREAGVRHDLIDAVFKLEERKDEIVGNLARVHALQNFVGTEDGTNLLAAYKRAANILKKENWEGHEAEVARTGEEDPLALVDDPDLAPIIAAKMAERKAPGLSYTPDAAEEALIEALDAAEPKAAAAIETEDFETAMAALASLRAPIDRFFEEVTVNAEDQSKRAARLGLLARFRAAVHKVADFSHIEG
ncbi:glycine--tRNA ligase subunit beta [Altericroceibacterium xinjiangense]|uniref:glycine--tRNA ligase subunit beta n=1 Tax=Altericroceibacterium xinjiangense TaxID=762261 RepID=UPI000F7EE1C1|nr:glycine--tRNA ligase subunit beta [Altericroceibacterium xinjiangense]